MKIEIKLEELQVKAILKSILNAYTGHREEVLNALGDFVIAKFTGNVIKGQTAYGSPLSLNEPSTLEKKRRKGYGSYSLRELNKVGGDSLANPESFVKDIRGDGITITLSETLTDSDGKNPSDKYMYQSYVDTAYGKNYQEVNPLLSPTFYDEVMDFLTGLFNKYF